jgi:hypothetical protein
MYVDQLTSFIAPPQQPHETGTPKTWEKVENRLGSALPEDYKSFVDSYGTGSFDDFISVYNPFAANENLNLFYVLDVLYQADRGTHLKIGYDWTAVHPFKLFPAREGLLPWGGTASFGDFFFWQVKGSPQSWETIFYNLRSGEYEVWKYPLTEFLYRLFQRQIESVLLPENYPPRQTTLSFIPGLP